MIDLPGRLRARRERRAHRQAALEEVDALARRPLISIVMPTYETEPRYLRAAIDSVRAQGYPHWELCIADDGSRSPGVRSEIERYLKRDRRIRATFLPENRGISAASNAALELCRGEFVAFCDHDDELLPEALLVVATALAADPEIDVVYSDSDKLTPRGRRQDPFLKPDYSATYALGAMYVGHLLVMRRSLVAEAGGFDPGFDTIQDFELFLRVSERAARIEHVPSILYGWRAIPGSIAAGTREKPGVPELQARAVSEHLSRLGVPARAEPHPAIPHRARLVPGPDAPRGRVSVILGWRGRAERLVRALGSVCAVSDWPELEVLVVTERGAGEPVLPDDGRIELVAELEPGDGFARAANLGAARASGEHLLFLSDFAEVTEPDWVEMLMLHARLPGAVAAGPMLVRPDGRVEQAGLAIGLHPAPAMAIHSGIPADGDGYYGSLPCPRDVSALSGECMLIEAGAFRELGGFCEEFRTSYWDVDLCQRLRAGGGRLVYAPRPRVVTHETPAEREATLDVIDRALFVDRFYDELLRGDPFYNPGFSRANAGFLPAV